MEKGHEGSPIIKLENDEPVAIFGIHKGSRKVNPEEKESTDNIGILFD